MDWQLIALISVAVVITGISKGGFSGSFGIIAVPLISLKMSPMHAAAIMLPIICIMDLFTVQRFWKRWETSELVKCIPAAIVGVIIGGLTVDRFSEDWLRMLVGIIAVGFSINSWPRKNRIKDLPPLGSFASKFWCILSGVTSTIAHAGGAPMNVYLLRAKLDKTRYVATAAAVFTAINYAKLIPYTLLGELHIKTVLISLCFIPLAYLGVQIGAWLHFKLSSDAFFKCIFVFLFLTGIKLIWGSLLVIL